MRVFSTFDNRPAETNNSKRVNKKRNGPKKVKTSYRPPKDNLSAEEIRAKVAAKTSKTAKKPTTKSGKQVSTFMKMNTAVEKAEISAKAKAARAAKKVAPKEEEVGTVKKDIMLNSDIAANDPKDTNTQEKLRGLLGAGGFGWNDKEREALSQILGET